jgi:D-alanine-D-alanine ligase
MQGVIDMKIVVLCGGISTEREVSINTGKTVSTSLSDMGHQVVMLDVFVGKDISDVAGAFGECYNVEEIAEELQAAQLEREQYKDLKREFFGPNVLKLCKEADIVFMALHGEDGENGKIQACFDMLSIKYTGTGCLGSGLAMDKNIAKQLFIGNNIPTPAGKVLKKENREDREGRCEVPFPCVVKPCCGGSSVGVFIVNNDAEYRKAVKEAFDFEDEVLVEEYIKGREFSVGVVADEAYPIIEIAPIEGFYDYKNKYTANMAIETCPAKLSDEVTKQMQKYAVQVFKALKLEAYSRIDFLLNEEGKMYCLEANTLPGMTPTSLLPQEAAALGMSFGELCERLIEVSMEKYR